MKLSWRHYLLIVAAIGLLVVFATDQVVPPATPYQAELRIWLVGRATGIASLLLLTLLTVLGILLSHPEQARWKQAKRLYPWHESAWVFTLAFLGAHVVSLAADRYAGVGFLGAVVPGLSSYRTPWVALGTLSLYGLMAVGLSARFTRLLPSGGWLRLHRLSGIVLVAGWLHGVLAGTDTAWIVGIYAASGVAVVAAAGYRYWVLPRRSARAAARGSSLPHGVPRAAPSPPPAAVPVPVPVMEETDVRLARSS